MVKGVQNFMKKTNRKRPVRVLGVFLAAVMLLSSVPVLGTTALAQGMKGAFFLSGNPAFAYVITGLKPEDADNTVKLYQNANMQSYESYTGVYEIPEKAYDSDEMRYYTVTEIGGAVGDSTPGALQNVPLRGITLPRTVTTVGSKAFAGCTSLTEVSFPTSVTNLAPDAFTGTLLQKLTLNVVTEASLASDFAYSSALRAAPVNLPCQVTDLTVSAPLAVTGTVTVPGDTVLSGSAVTVQPGAALTLRGALSGSGVIEVANNGTLTLDSAALAAFHGRIVLSGTISKLVNLTSTPVSVTDASGNTAVVKPGETRTGGQAVEDPDDEPEANTRPQISVNYGGTVSVEESGKVVLITAYNGYHVEEVVINGQSMGTITRYEFEQASSQNTVAVTFAQGKDEEGPDVPNVDPIFTFTDVAPDAWYAESVSFMVKNNIFQGVTKTRFAPNQETTRAMFVTLLKRLETYGEDFQVVCKEPVYPSDTVENAWYYEAAGWAVGAGIFPLDGGDFQPSQPITREEIALCLYHFTHARGYDTITDESKVDGYVDGGSVAAASREAVAWAVSNGYLHGKSGSMLDPSGAATRVEIAEILTRYLKVN